MRWAWVGAVAIVWLGCASGDDGGGGGAPLDHVKRLDGGAGVADAPVTPPDPRCAGGCGLVMNALSVPADESAAMAWACDVDGNGSRENALGAVLGLAATLAAGGATVQGAIDDALLRGELIVLWRVTSSDLESDGQAVLESWLGADGDADPGNDFTGDGAFAIAPDSPRRNLLAGTLLAHVGAFTGGALTIALPLYAGQPPLPIELAGAQVRGTFGPGAIVDGTLCGAVPADAFRQTVVPSVAGLLNAMCASNPSGGTCAAVRATFDEDRDGTITASELLASAVLQRLTAPDVDAFIGDPAERVRGHDCTYSSKTPIPDDRRCLDSISLGVGHTAVGARFAAP